MEEKKKLQSVHLRSEREPWQRQVVCEERIAIRDGGEKAVIHFRHRCAKKDSRWIGSSQPTTLDVEFLASLCAKIYRLPSR